MSFPSRKKYDSCHAMHRRLFLLLSIGKRSTLRACIEVLGNVDLGDLDFPLELSLCSFCCCCIGTRTHRDRLELCTCAANKISFSNLTLCNALVYWIWLEFFESFLSLTQWLIRNVIVDWFSKLNAFDAFFSLLILFSHVKSCLRWKVHRIAVVA